MAAAGDAIVATRSASPSYRRTPAARRGRHNPSSFFSIGKQFEDRIDHNRQLVVRERERAEQQRAIVEPRPRNDPAAFQQGERSRLVDRGGRRESDPAKRAGDPSAFLRMIIPIDTMQNYQQRNAVR